VKTHPLQAFSPNGLIDYFLNFGKMFIRKIIKIAATRCHILKLQEAQLMLTMDLTHLAVNQGQQT